jgi:hypothetical protein
MFVCLVVFLASAKTSLMYLFTPTVCRSRTLIRATMLKIDCRPSLRIA